MVGWWLVTVVVDYCVVEVDWLAQWLALCTLLKEMRFRYPHYNPTDDRS